MPNHLEICSRHQTNSKSSKRLKKNPQKLIKKKKTQKDSKYNSSSDCN